MSEKFQDGQTLMAEDLNNMQDSIIKNGEDLGDSEYVRQTFVDGETILKAEHLNKMQDAIIKHAEKIAAGVGGSNDIIKVEELPPATVSVEGTAVPGSGVVKKLYFNTKLPPLEVKEILDSLEFVTIDLLPYPIVAIVADSALAEGVMIVKLSGVQQDGVSEGVSYMIIYNNANDTSKSKSMYTYSNLKGETSVSNNWEGINELEINIDNVLDLAGPSMGMLNQNEALKNIISTTPFEDVNPDIQTDKLYYAPVFEGGELQGTVVPNNGIVEKLYFNTNMPISELKEILNSSITWTDASVLDSSLADAGFEFYPVLAYTREAGTTIVPYVLAMKRYTKDIAGHKTGEIDMALIDMPYFNEVEVFYVDANGGWDKFANPYYLGFEVIPELNGLPIGSQNEALKNVISITPFEVVGAEVTGYDYNRIKNGKWVTFGTTIYKNGKGVTNVKVLGNTGSILQLAVNTNLSNNEVMSILNKIPDSAFIPVEDNTGIYPVANFSEDGEMSICIMRMVLDPLTKAAIYMMAIGNINTLANENILGVWCTNGYEETASLITSFGIGWNPESVFLSFLDENMVLLLSSVGFENMVLLDTYGDFPCGVHNEVIKEFIAEDWEIFEGKIPVIELSGEYEEVKTEVFGSTTIKPFEEDKKIVTEIKTNDLLDILIKNKGWQTRYHYLFNEFTAGQEEWDKFKNLKFPEPVTSGKHMFANCNNMEYIPFELNVDNLSDGTYMFYQCQECKNLPEIYKALTDGTYMFSDCDNLINFYRHGSGGLKMDHMFYSCYKLKLVEIDDSISCYDMGSAFSYCKELESVSLSTSPSSGISFDEDTFKGCTKLKYLTIKNIKNNLTIGDGTSSNYSQIIDLSSLVELCKECIQDTKTRHTLKIGTANMNTINNNNIYVALSGEAEENSSYPKLPVNQVTNNTTGAMTLVEYMNLKNWDLIE